MHFLFTGAPRSPRMDAVSRGRAGLFYSREFYGAETDSNSRNNNAKVTLTLPMPPKKLAARKTQWDDFNAMVWDKVEDNEQGDARKFK